MVARTVSKDRIAGGSFHMFDEQRDDLGKVLEIRHLERERRVAECLGHTRSAFLDRVGIAVDRCDDAERRAVHQLSRYSNNTETARWSHEFETSMEPSCLSLDGLEGHRGERASRHPLPRSI